LSNDKKIKAILGRTKLIKEKKDSIENEISKMATCAAKWEYIEKILNNGTQIDKNSVIFIKLLHLHPKKCSR
jgi:hypothetical protein